MVEHDRNHGVAVTVFDGLLHSRDRTGGDR